MKAKLPYFCMRACKISDLLDTLSGAVFVASRRNQNSARCHSFPILDYTFWTLYWNAARTHFRSRGILEFDPHETQSILVMEMILEDRHFCPTYSILS